MKATSARRTVAGPRSGAARRGRASFERNEWNDAFEALTRVASRDRSRPTTCIGWRGPRD